MLSISSRGSYELITIYLFISVTLQQFIGNISSITMTHNQILFNWTPTTHHMKTEAVTCRKLIYKY